MFGKRRSSAKATSYVNHNPSAFNPSVVSPLKQISSSLKKRGSFRKRKSKSSKLVDSDLDLDEEDENALPLRTPISFSDRSNSQSSLPSMSSEELRIGSLDSHTTNRQRSGSFSSSSSVTPPLSAATTAESVSAASAFHIPTEPAPLASTSRIEMTFQCRDLKRSKLLSNPNTFCVLYRVDPNHLMFEQEQEQQQDATASSPANRRTAFLRKFRFRSTQQTNIYESTEGEYEIGRTETVYNTTCPSFSVRIETDYNFQQEQLMVLRVYDDQGTYPSNDDSDDDDDDDDYHQFSMDDEEDDYDHQNHQQQHHQSTTPSYHYVGGTTFTLGQLMGSAGNALGRTLSTNKPKDGFIVIQAEEVMVKYQDNMSYGPRDLLQLRLQATNLKNTDTFLPSMFGGSNSRLALQKSDPFFRLERKCPQQKSWQSIGVSNILSNELNPTWDTLEVPFQQVCNGDLYRKLRIHIQDWDGESLTRKTPDDLGFVETTLPHLLSKPRYKIMRYSSRHQVCVPKGELHVVEAQIVPQPTMIEYLKGGCQLKLHVAVDFGSTSDSPNRAEDLHSLAQRENEYMMAIDSIGSILADYSSSGQFTMSGFGATLDGSHSDFFPLTNKNNTYNSQLTGVDSLLDAYEQCLNQPGFELSNEPTRMASTIEHAMKNARDSSSSSNNNKNQESSLSSSSSSTPQEQIYHVLCILTDGCISDMDDTMDMICQASKKDSGPPLSIIIVGVGQHGNFEDMVLLDGDHGQLKAADRDIVQFVPFREYVHDPLKLAEETLEEVPDQLIEYFTSREVYPNPPVVPSFVVEDDKKKVCMEYSDDEDDDEGPSF
mmetsp:Transcript_28363/g.43495  ORF Transcript_28363/g.43495 Transcript_28363/m.43495 type:complete len:825 (+) Transcript_28363:303-2777(+)